MSGDDADVGLESLSEHCLRPCGMRQRLIIGWLHVLMNGRFGARLPVDPNEAKVVHRRPPPLPRVRLRLPAGDWVLSPMGPRTEAERRFVLLALCIFCSLGFSEPALAQQLRVSAPMELKPFSGPVLAIMRDAGFAPIIDYYPNERSFQMLQFGQVDVEFARTAESVEGFKSEVRLIGPLACAEVVAFVNLRRGVAFRDVRDLHGLKIGVVLGNKLALSYLKSAGLEFTALATRVSAYAMLELGHVDVVVDTWAPGQSFVITQGAADHLKVQGPVLVSRPNYLVLRHRLDEWGTRLELAYSTTVASGRWLKQVEKVNASMGLAPGARTSCLHASSAH